MNEEKIFSGEPTDAAAGPAATAVAPDHAAAPIKINRRPSLALKILKRTLIGAGALDDAHAAAALTDAALAAGLPTREVRRTIASGLGAGRDRPRSLAQSPPPGPAAARVLGASTAQAAAPSLPDDTRAAHRGRSR